MKKLITILAATVYFNVSAQIIITTAGNGTGGYNGDGGPANTKELNNPYGVATDQYRNLYIADLNNNVIRKVIASTGIITTVAGNLAYGYSGDNGPATAARLSSPFAVAIDGTGNMYIADRDNNCIRKVTTSGIISTFAGNATLGYSGDGGAATAAQLAGPIGLAVDATGNVYIADYYNNRIRMVTPLGIISTVAGNGTQGYSGDGASANNAELANPTGVTVDVSGNIYIADYTNNRVRMVKANTGLISTIAGNGIAAYHGDGGAADTSSLNHPWGVAFGSGNLFIADYANHRIRKVSNTGKISTVTGNGIEGYFGDCGTPIAAEVYYPAGLALDTYGNLFIADNKNNRVRKLLFSASKIVVTAHSSLANVCSGKAVTFTGGGASTYTWTHGIINGTPQVLYNDSIKAKPITNTVTGTDTIGCTNSAVITVLVNPLPIISAASTTICVGQYTTLTAVSTSTAIVNYSWTGGIVNGVPFTPNVTSSYLVTGTDINGCSNSSTAMVTVIQTSNPLPIISISTSTNVLTTCGDSAILTASGASTYTWSTGKNGTSIIVAPNISTTYTVTGSLQGCTTTNTLTLIVDVIHITSSIDSICKGSPATLTASGASSYTWVPSPVNVATGATFVVTPTVSTTYTVTGKNGKCSSNNTFTQIVRSLNISSTDTFLCNGAPVVLTATGANTYTWSTGQNGASITVTPTVTTNYTASGMFQTCKVINTFLQIVQQPVLLNVSSSVDSICEGGVANLTASGANNYLWNTSQSGASISVTPTLTTTYTVTGVSSGCSSMATIQLKVDTACFMGIKQETGINNNISIYPNPATNGSFTVSFAERKENSNISIINTLGQKIFETRNIEPETQITLPNCLPGVYYVQINNGTNGASVKKIIVN